MNTPGVLSDRTTLQHQLVGELGAEHLVFSDPAMRMAERATTAGTVETADGPQRYQKGDFLVSMPDGERFPIRASIYFGAYEVVGRIGPWFIGRRLLQLRRFWPVTSAAVELSSANGRGPLHATRGAWVYQVDDDDIGLINGSVNTRTHTVVGPSAVLAQGHWKRRYDRASLALILLPPVLTGLGLAAFVTAVSHPRLSVGLVAAELVLLLAGTLLAWQMHRQRWAMRAAAVSGLALAQRFQVAVAALGQRTSADFPLMALWRAAQTDEPAPRAAALDADALRPVSTAIDATRDEIEHRLHATHRGEHIAERCGWAGAAFICLCLGVVVAVGVQLLWFGRPAPFDAKPFKLLAAWLPAVLGTIHAFHARQALQANHAAGKQLLLELKFLRTRMLGLTAGVWAPAATWAGAGASTTEADAGAEARDSLRLLCRCVGSHVHRGLEAAASARVGPPA